MAIRIADTSNEALFDEPEPMKSPVRFGLLHKLRNRFSSKEEAPTRDQTPNTRPEQQTEEQKEPGPKRIGIGPPRQQTFKRQNSEKREKLERVRPCEHERRTLSVSRKRALSVQGDSVYRQRTRSSPPTTPRWSLPALGPQPSEDLPATWTTDKPDELQRPPEAAPAASPVKAFIPDDADECAIEDDDLAANTSYDEQLQQELDSKWILNLSMHFRDKSDREKFFLTYAEKPNKWRRVTVSCDYRHAESGSLEMDLKELHYQRDKNFQIYESIRDSLPEIQFYDTVTNLKLETRDGRLHVHVTEDVNEIIAYPPRYSIEHLLDDWDPSDQFSRLRTFTESEVEFHSHLSGFVYRVKVYGQDYIKKEIPGPDSVEEFLYEINALHALVGSSNVIQLQAIILDDDEKLVKGLLINYAEKGALVDLLFDNKNTQLPWEERLHWAEQVVSGLNNIHEAGFVQGDFTLSNVVVDEDGNASIIDINRRGCPVGWEPPEMEKKIQSNQRISMYIGVKSDLFQLGMVLWALAMHDDEPERQLRPLRAADLPREIPEWFRNIVEVCLSQRPQGRMSAKQLLKCFRKAQYNAAELQGDTNAQRRLEQIVEVSPFQPPTPPKSRAGEHGMDDDCTDGPPSSTYRLESDASYVAVSPAPTRQSERSYMREPERGRRRSRDDELDFEDDMSEPQILSISPGYQRQFDELELDGHPYLIARDSFSPEEIALLEQDLDHQKANEDESINLGPRDSVSTVAPTNDHQNESQSDLPDTTAESRPMFRDPCLSELRPDLERPISLPSVSPLDTSQLDLTGFGGHPDLGRHSPEEPDLLASDHQLDTTDRPHVPAATELAAAEGGTVF